MHRHFVRGSDQSETISEKALRDRRERTVYDSSKFLAGNTRITADITEHLCTERT